jgi:hypothetical protein
VQSGWSSWAGEWPRLLTNAGVYKTVKQYFQMVRSFLDLYKFDPELRAKVPHLATEQDLDQAMTWWMERRCYRDLRSAQDGKNLRSGVLHLAPELKGEVPLSTRASRTWEKLEGNPEREPLCREMSGLIVEAIAKREKRMAWGALSQLDCLLREQDLEALLIDDVSVGNDGSVSLELGVLDRGESTKSGTSQGVVVREDHLKHFFRVCKEVLASGSRVFPFPQARYRKVVHEAVGEAGCGMDAAEVTPHVFRGSGAVFLLYVLDWPIPKVVDRGRWGSVRSMAPYAKKHLFVRNESRLDDPARDRGRFLWSNPIENMGLIEHPRMAISKSDGAADPFSNLVSSADLELPASVDSLSAKGAYPDLDSLR